MRRAKWILLVAIFRLRAIELVLAFALLSPVYAAAEETTSKETNTSSTSPAASQASSSAPATAASGSPEATGKEAVPTESEVEVDSIKEKYWAKGEESDLGVVQNRLFSKKHAFDLGFMGGFSTSDPFLTVKHGGLKLGYHPTEYIGFHLLALKYWASGSTALKTFEEFRGATVNTNNPEYYYGFEGTGSLLYGKLSFLGIKIMHYDLHLALNLGLTNTENGNFITPGFGVGQRFYITQFMSFRVDYRMHYFREDIKEKVIPTKLGQVVGTRNNFTNNISFGFEFMVKLFE